MKDKVKLLSREYRKLDDGVMGIIVHEKNISVYYDSDESIIKYRSIIESRLTDLGYEGKIEHSYGF